MHLLKVGKRNQSKIEHLPPRMLDRLMNRVHMVYPLAWHRLFKKLHFGDGASKRYRYRLRDGEQRNAPPVKGSYTAKKLRIYKHTRPLEFTGRAMESAMDSDGADVGKTRGGNYRARARLGPGFNRRNPKQSSVNPAHEVTTVLGEENRILDSLAQEKLNAEIRRHSGYRG